MSFLRLAARATKELGAFDHKVAIDALASAIKAVRRRATWFASGNRA